MAKEQAGGQRPPDHVVCTPPGSDEPHIDPLRRNPLPPAWGQIDDAEAGWIEIRRK